MSHVIEWSVQRMKTQRFVYELELAIPKIQSVKIQQQAQYIVPQQVEVHGEFASFFFGILLKS